MTTFLQEYRFHDKPAWGQGPSGALCGYVGLPPEHLWHGVEYDGCLFGASCPSRTGDDRWDTCYEHSPAYRAEVHGGLTYSGYCQEHDENTGICHVPQPGRPHRVWWLGFDCAHAGDVSPKHESHWRTMPMPAGYEVYRDLAYVQAEVTSLARQIAAAGSPG